MDTVEKTHNSHNKTPARTVTAAWILLKKFMISYDVHKRHNFI